jgi:hypothetical protein
VMVSDTHTTLWCMTEKKNRKEVYFPYSNDILFILIFIDALSSVTLTYFEIAKVIVFILIYKSMYDNIERKALERVAEKRKNE